MGLALSEGGGSGGGEGGGEGEEHLAEALHPRASSTGILPL